MSGYYKSRHRHRLAVSPKRGVSSYAFSHENRQSDFHIKKQEERFLKERAMDLSKEYREWIP